MPSSTPTKATPRKVAASRAASVRLILSNRRNVFKSRIDAAATITTPASTLEGRNAVTPGATIMNSATRSAPTAPLRGLLAPAARAIGVREALPEIGKPPKRPLATFATPRAPISWFPSTWTPLRAAKLFDRTDVSAKAIRAMPAAGPSKAMTSSRLIPPRAGDGRPRGREPTVGSAVVRSSAAVSAVAATTAIRTPGSFHGRKLHPTITAMVPAPNSKASGLMAPWATAWAVPAAVPASEPPVPVMPSSLGSWLSMMTRAIPLR